MATKSLSKKLESELGPVSFGMFMRVSRNSLGFTQQEMADLLGIAKGTLCDIEKGRQFVSVVFATKVAKKAGLSSVMAVEACFVDQLSRSNLGYQVKVRMS